MEYYKFNNKEVKGMRKSKIALTVQEASEYTGIGRNNLRWLIQEGFIPVIRVGKKVLIRICILDQFMAANEGKDITRKGEIIAVWK